MILEAASRGSFFFAIILRSCVPMRRMTLLLLITPLLFFSSCTSHPKVLTEEERCWQRVDSLKAMAHDGDLVTRLNDNIISHQVRFLSREDKSFSHGGIIQTINGVKMVCHIDAGNPGADTLQYEPVDSFLNPSQNLACGLFRYDLGNDEKNRFLANINAYHAAKIHFDHDFLLETDSAMYCSEMIYKSLRAATHNRILLKETLIPERMLKMVYIYTERKHPMDWLAKEPIMAVDQLFLNPHCREIVRYTLKKFPGQ